MPACAAARIIDEVGGIDRVVHDIAPQPPVAIGRERCDNSAQSTRTYHPTAPQSLCFRLAKSLEIALRHKENQ
jgi:hypothetical protein